MVNFSEYLFYQSSKEETVKLSRLILKAQQTKNNDKIISYNIFSFSDFFKRNFL